MGATFTSFRLEISLEVGGAGNIVISLGVSREGEKFLWYAKSMRLSTTIFS